MLQRLALEEFVLFDAAALEFGPGLNVLTGETGAGKSILIDALGLIAGGRASAEWIRPGAERLSVEAIFDLGSSPQTFLRQLEDSGVRLDESHLLALRRELSRDGRSRTFANGRSVLVSDLKAWSPYLLRLVCQGDARELESPAVLEGLLDREGGTTAEAQSYREERQAWKRAELRLRELRDESAALRREEDWLRFQREEIRAADVRPAEREEVADRLRQERVRQASTALLEEARARIAREEGSVLDHLETLAHRFRSVELPEGPLGQSLRELQERVIALREEARAVARLLEVAEDEPVDPLDLEERLRQLDRLRKKYGGDEDAILAHLARVEERLDRLEALGDEELLAERALNEARVTLGRVGANLASRRREAGEALGKRATELLRLLAMPGATLAFGFDRLRPQGGDAGPIQVEGEAIEPLEGGIDRITLRFQSHAGENWGGLSRIASGGELSRVLLALESAARTRSGSAWVFDEIDAGIGGETANRVAAHLQALAGRSQVLLVTHLPVIAARATRHLVVKKDVAGTRVSAAVTALDPERRIAEIARMLSGDAASEAAHEHARALIVDAGSAGGADQTADRGLRKGTKRSGSERPSGQGREETPAPQGRPVQTGRRVR